MIYWLLKYKWKIRSSMSYKLNFYSPVGKKNRKITFYWLKTVLFLQDAWLNYHQYWHSCRLGIKFCQYVHQPFLAKIWAKIQRNSAYGFNPTNVMLFTRALCSFHNRVTSLADRLEQQDIRAILKLNNIEPLFLDLVMQRAEHLSLDVTKCF